MPGRKFRGSLERVGLVGHVMVLFETRFQAVQNCDRLLDAWFRHIYFLETSRKCMIFLENSTILGVRRGPDTANLAVGEDGLDQVAGIHDAAGRRTGADDRMDLVDKQDRTGVFLNLGNNALQALFEIPAVLGAGDQGAHVERVDRRVQQHLGHALLRDHPRQALGQRSLADPGLANVQRVVLTPAAENLHGPLDLDLAANQRIDLAVNGHLVEVRRKLFERRLFRLASAVQRHLVVLRPLARHRRHAVGDVIDHVKARYVLEIQEVDSLRLFFAEDRHEHVGAGDFFLAARLHVKDSALQHPLEAERRLHFGIGLFRQQRRLLVDKFGELPPEFRDIAFTGLEDLVNLRNIEQRQQQVFDRHELVTAVPRALKRLIQTKFQFTAQHRNTTLLRILPFHTVAGAGAAARYS